MLEEALRGVSMRSPGGKICLDTGALVRFPVVRKFVGFTFKTICMFLLALFDVVAVCLSEPAKEVVRKQKYQLLFLCI